jgi:large subunit ribosomal protein L6
MSRVGKNPVAIPDGVEIKKKGRDITAKGKLGTESFTHHPAMTVEVGDGAVTVKRPSDQKEHRALHGLTRQLVNNLVIGVSEGFSKELEIIGVGYRARVEGKKVVLSLGYSHEINYPFPEGVTIEVEGNTKVKVSGTNKQKVGQAAAEIRAFRSPEPYKGKGVRYVGEYVRKKAGKSGVA